MTAAGAPAMRFAVESWSPEYGSPTELPAGAGERPESEVPVDVTVERPAEAWVALSPPPSTALAASVSFVDGVRRIEARVWVTGADGVPHQGICASYAAGVVRCAERAVVQEARVGRAVFCRADGAADIETRHGRFPLRVTADADAGALYSALHGSMTDLELAVSTAVAEDTDLLIVDGPLRDRRVLPGTVGYVKTHHVDYLPTALRPVVGLLGGGQRTPVFCIGGPYPRHSWYLRLPGEITHPWAGVVRCEVASAMAVADVIAVADRVSRQLLRYASTPHKDPRAPQNLFPIAGLERELRHRMGDTLVLQRALREVARSSQAGVGGGP